MNSNLLITRLHFNSQPHKEADEAFLELLVLTEHFNSQPHKEADPSVGVGWQYSSISTHSLTRRLTQKAILTVRCPEHFNSQPHKEADCHTIHHLKHRRYFNSQPHKEADQIAIFM